MHMRPSQARALLQHRAAKPVVWLICFGPLAWLIAGAWLDALGANPAEYLIRSTGELTLRMLCVTLSITPLRVWCGWPEWARFRRLLGLWTFAYALLHALGYAWFDMGLAWDDIWRDINKRPFILVGVLGLTLLTPLAATSFNAAVRRLGGARWRRLHQSVYLIAPLAVLHFYWMRAGKQRFDDVWIYGLWLASALLWRLWHFWQKRQLGLRQSTSRS
jgi:sulfoxide reductase heme-binding subunit YedZ